MNHDEIIRRNWIENIQPEDQVLHLGDLQVWYKDDWIKSASDISRSLTGEKFIIRGNHDKFLNGNDYLGFDLVPEFIEKIQGRRILFSHYPDNHRIGHWDINIHGHIHNSGYGAEYDRTLDYRNVSIEVMDYKPVRLRDILFAHNYESIREAPLATHS